MKIINMYNIEGNGYADDCSALYGGPRLEQAINKLQKMLNSLTAWGKRCGLRFNPEKSTAIIFTRSRKSAPKALVIDGKEVPYKESVKYLGVTLDRKLHWKQHIDEKVTRAKRFISNVACITRKNWGPKPKLMRWAYLGVVRPMLAYGAMIWGHRAQYHTAKLSRINRMGMNTFGSFPKSTPTAAMELILDVTPLHLHCIQEGLASKIRLHDTTRLHWSGTSANKTHSMSHLRFWNNQMNKYNFSPDNIDSCSQVRWNADFRINYDSFDGKRKHRTPTQYNVFTDGSRLDGRTGAGYVIYKGKNEIFANKLRLPDHATVFQAEIKAIEAACHKLGELNPPNMKYVKIFVDSQAAIRALGNPRVRSRAVASASEELNRLAGITRSATICWIAAHKGYTGNERADTMAKEGSTKNQIDIQVGRSPATIRVDIAAQTQRDWTTAWTNYEGAVHTKQFYSAPCPRKAKYVYNLARLELGRFIRLITGHNNLNYFQHRLGLQESSSCRFCNTATETYRHLVTECPRWRLTRVDLFQDRDPCSDMSWSVRKLLDFSYNPAINEAFEGTWAHNDPPGTDDLDSSRGGDNTTNDDSTGSATGP